MGESRSIFELDLFNLLFSLSGRSTMLDEVLVFLAEFLILALVLVVASLIVYALSKGRPRQAWILFVGLFAGALAWLASMWAKTFFQTVRPFADKTIIPLVESQTNSTAFPSAHAAAVAAAGVVLYRFNKFIGLATIALAFIIGIARVAIGVHWPIDIAGGVVCGIVLGWIVRRLLCGRKEK